MLVNRDQLLLRELVLLPGPLTRDREEWLAAHPAVDAFGAPTWGQQRTFAYATSPTSGTKVSEPPLDICNGDPDCVHFLLGLIGRVIPCTVPADVCNVQYLLTFELGQEVEFELRFREQEDSFEGVTVAGALLVGAGTYDGLVEVVGSDPRAVLAAGRGLTRIRGVASVEAHVFRAEDTRNWGSLQL